MYIGRFAPSPTGPLHFGSLVAAVASYCDAKANQGKWLVRMEDLDKSREVFGASDTILRTLEAFGFEWDAPVVLQSQRTDIYEKYFLNLIRSGFVYSCTCSRKEIADSATHSGIEGAIYPKTCLPKTYFNSINLHNTYEQRAAASHVNAGSWRINVDDAGNIQFEDAIQNTISQTLKMDVGDFILKRKEGFFAYQLAVVVDDALQNITHIVRGADLLDSTPRQIYLQQLLRFSVPNYAHVPVAINAYGEKLSKQTLAKPINISLAGQQIVEALTFLGQNPPAELNSIPLADTWAWAIKHWNLAGIPKQKQIRADQTFYEVNV